MASDLLTIAASGTRAARVALDITAQNIANASTEGYVRRSVTLADLTSPNARASYGDVSQYGVRVVGIERNVDSFLQAEVRRYGHQTPATEAYYRTSLRKGIVSIWAEWRWRCGSHGRACCARRWWRSCGFRRRGRLIDCSKPAVRTEPFRSARGQSALYFAGRHRHRLYL